MLGNLFSHHQTKHFLMNMAALYIFGPGLHEDVGRGTFLAIYLASGLLGGFVSLANYVLRGIMVTSSMGASGCIWGVTSAYLWIHSEHTFTLFFVPEAWKESLQMKGWFFLGLLMALDVFTSIRQRNVDVWAHWGGMAVGLGSSAWWKWNRRAESVNGRVDVAPKKSLMLVQEEERPISRRPSSG